MDVLWYEPASAEDTMETFTVVFTAPVEDGEVEMVAVEEEEEMEAVEEVVRCVQGVIGRD